MSDLHSRIAAAIYAALRQQLDSDGIQAPMVTPEIGGDRFSGIAMIDGEVNLMAIADAVIRELGLEPQAHYDPDCDFYRYVTDWIAPK